MLNALNVDTNSQSHRIISWDEVGTAVEAIGVQLRRDDFIPHRILHIAHGGLYPAIALRDYILEHTKKQIWNYPISVNKQKQRVRFPFRLRNDRRYLIVDDIHDSGKTYQLVNNRLPEEVNVRFAFLYIRNYDNLGYYEKSNVYVGIKLNDPRWLDFPWEIQNDPS